MDGGLGTDLLTGGDGDDSRGPDAGLLGGPGDDELYGEAGDGALNRGPGNDVINAAAGEDRRGRDIVDCGAGFDAVTANRNDTPLNCEEVYRRPNPRGR